MRFFVNIVTYFLEKNPITSLLQVEPPSIEMQTSFRKTPITPARIVPLHPSVTTKSQPLPKTPAMEKPREQALPSSTPFRDISTSGSSRRCVRCSRCGCLSHSSTTSLVDDHDLCRENGYGERTGILHPTHPTGAGERSDRSSVRKSSRLDYGRSRSVMSCLGEGYQDAGRNEAERIRTHCAHEGGIHCLFSKDAILFYAGNFYLSKRFH